MELMVLPYNFTICKINNIQDLDLNKEFYFFSKTDKENSLVCKTEDTPVNIQVKEDGWKAFRIQGELDFSLIGILARISTILANNKIGIFVVSTFDTDYILVKSDNLDKAIKVLKDEGYNL